MPTKRVAVLLLSALWAIPSPAVSQRVPEVGDRVRVRQIGLRRPHYGTVSSISSQGIRIADSHGQSTFVVGQAIERLEVSDGEYVREGHDGIAMLGLLGITGASAGIMAASWSPCTDTGFFACMWHPESRGKAALTGALIGFPVGLIFAIGIGRDRVSEAWVEAELPGGSRHPTIGLFRGPTAGGIGVGISLPIGSH